MSAEQTPDIETALTEAEVNALGPFIWGGWLGVDPEKHSDYAHELLELVGHIKADALAAAVREVLDAAHEAADELDEWDGHPSAALGGVSPGGAVRHRVHAAAGVSIDECPSCADRITEPVSHEAATSGEEASKA